MESRSAAALVNFCADVQFFKVRLGHQIFNEIYSDLTNVEIIYKNFADWIVQFKRVHMLPILNYLITHFMKTD
jgi:hypothetical protein